MTCASFKLYTAECPCEKGTFYYDGHKHGVVIVSADPTRPRRRGRKDEALWGYTVDTLLEIVRRGGENSLSGLYQSIFFGPAFPSNQQFIDSVNRCRHYILDNPSTAPSGGVAVMDVKVQSPLPEPCSHFGDKRALGPTVNPSLPVIGLLGDELSFFPFGVPHLTDNLSTENVREVFRALAFQSDPGTFYWGVRTSPPPPPLRRGALLEFTRLALHWSRTILSEFSFARDDGSRVATVVSMARSLGAVLPLLASFCIGSDDEVVVPKSLGLLLTALSSEATISAAGCFPTYGALIFPALCTHIVNGGNLNLPLPNALLCIEGAPTLESLMNPDLPHAHKGQKYMHQVGEVPTWATACQLLAPEVAMALLHSKVDHRVLLPILERYASIARIAACIGTGEVRVLLPKPRPEAHRIPRGLFVRDGSIMPFETQYDIQAAHCATMSHAASMAEYAHEIEALEEGLKFERPSDERRAL
jgi:hypothetical protein